MPEFSVNNHRYDPYKNLRFKVRFADNGEYVAGVSKVSGLKRKSEEIEHSDGVEPHTTRKSPRRTNYEPIILERGVTHSAEFAKWADQVWRFSALNSTTPTILEVSLSGFRKDLMLELFDEGGQLVMRYLMYRCWVSEFQALPDLDANANAVAIQTITLENSGYERDYSITEPKEMPFSEPAN